ncbi:hypothetical protein J6590_078892 [Homalodisca vitripennis]|nr:hypothetical protein J6590_078892 [Homalodisca vitripennis]
MAGVMTREGVALSLGRSHVDKEWNDRRAQCRSNILSNDTTIVTPIVTISDLSSVFSQTQRHALSRRARSRKSDELDEFENFPVTPPIAHQAVSCFSACHHRHLQYSSDGLIHKLYIIQPIAHQAVSCFSACYHSASPVLK